MIDTFDHASVTFSVRIRKAADPGPLDWAAWWQRLQLQLGPMGES